MKIALIEAYIIRLYIANIQRFSRSVNESSHLDSMLDGLALTEPVAANMALSTLLLRDIQSQHRRNPQNIRNVVPGVMPGIRESPHEDTLADPDEVAAVLSAAVKNLSTCNRTASSK